MGEPEAPDRSQWLTLVLDRYEGPLVRYALRITGELESARDVVQDAFIRLCQEDRTAVEDHVAQWLFTVCRHRALDVRRKDRRMTTLTQETVESRPSPDPPPDAGLETQEATSQVLSALHGLPENQQEAIRLKFQESLSYKEIAAITGHTVTNVGFLIHTGMKELRRRLSPEASGGL